MKGKLAIYFVLLTLVMSCHTVKKTPVLPPDLTAPPPVAAVPEPVKPKPNLNRTDELLENLLKTRPEFAEILANRDSLRVQIIYTQINRDAKNEPAFTNYYFNVNAANYFYPASTVKLPVAVLSLQRLNELKVYGLNSRSTMITEKAYSGQTAVYNDPTTPDGRPNIANYIKKIFLVSDNDAFNRLYEFLGQEYINAQLHKMDFHSADILHRLSIPLSEDENRHTNPVSFYNESSKVLYSQPMQKSKLSYPERYDSVGNGYLSGNKTVDTALVFSKKNRISLEDLSGMLRSIIFPLSVPLKQRFNLTPDDYRFVLRYMSQYPRESTFPVYDSASYPDAYGKFLFYGASKGELPEYIRIFNKIGDAYGFLNDVAYLVDFKNNIEFMLSATIYCNKDGILNDDKYDYETVGFPFMKNLGRLVYDFELSRPRSFQPDLSAFKMEYGGEQ